MEVFRDSTAELITHLNKIDGHADKKWVVCGNSIGGLCTINLASSASSVQHLISGLILFNTSGGLSSFRFSDYPPPLALVLYFVKNVVLRLGGPSFFQNFKTRENVERILNDQVYYNNENVDEDLVQMLLQPSDDDGAEEVFLNVFGAEPGVDPKELLPSVTAPILALWGTKDTWTPIAGGENLQQYATQTTFNLVPIEAGHCLHDESPDECHKHILPFLEELRK